MDSIAPTLIFDDTETGLKEKYSSKIFTQEIAEFVTAYYREGCSIKNKAIKLLQETYENNYDGFIR